VEVFACRACLRLLAVYWTRIRSLGRGTMGECESQSKQVKGIEGKAERKALQSRSDRFPVDRECDHGFTELSKALQSPEAARLNH